MIRLSGAGWRFPGGSVVGPVDLEVRAGELVLLTGPTGCGKSTVLRLAAGLLQRHGRGQLEGLVEIGARNPAELVAGDRVRALGFVGQDPDDGVVTASCGAEIAFGLESAGAPAGEIEARVAELLDRVGLASFAERSPHALSGGQRQRLVIAAALAAGARVLLLDEPLSQLDPDGASEVLLFLRELADEGVAILCVEHRLEFAMPLATRAVLMDSGRIVEDPISSSAALRIRGLRGPVASDLEELTGGNRWRRNGPAEALDARADRGGAALLSVADLRFGWPGGSPAVDGVGFHVRAGERVALVGPNGAGKSSLIGLLAGRLRPDGGSIQFAGRRPDLALDSPTPPRGGTPPVVEVPQNPDLALFCESVRSELGYGPVERAWRDVDARVEAAARALSIGDLLARPPQALSRGQRLRTAVAAAWTCEPEVLLLDEPTSGQDRDQVDRMLTALAERKEGCLIFASHDLDVVLRHASRVIALRDGRIVADGPPMAALIAAELPLPPLARLCVALSVPYGTPEQVAEQLRVDPEGERLGVAVTTRRDPRLPPPPAIRRASGGLDPRVRIATVFLFGLVVLCLDGPIPLGALAVLGTATALSHPRAAGWRLRFLGGALLLAWTTALSQGLFWVQWPRTPLVVFWHAPMIALYREGLLHGLVQSLRFVAVTAAGVWVSLTTSPDRLVAAMLALRVPYGIALMGATALRFLPMVGSELVAVRGARSHRGRPVWQRTPGSWVALEVSLLRPVVARSLRRARSLAESLETRGFHPISPRGVREPLKMDTRDRAALAGALLLSLFVVIARSLYVAYGAELYYSPTLRPLYAFVRAWM